jgi:hypothetical protein
LLAARLRAELLAVLAHDRRCGLKPNPDGASVIYEGALGGNSHHDVLGGQDRRHFTALERALSQGSRALG